MKKSLWALAIVSAMAMLFLGCPQQPKVTDDTLTGKIAAAGSSKDFAGAVIAEDAEVNKAMTISNLDMGGKTLTVKVSGVTLSNLKNVNVVAGAGIGDGDLIIEGSEIATLQVLGGGANSIHLKDSTAAEVSVEKAGVRVALEGETTISKVDLKADDVKLEAEETAEVSTLNIDAEVKGFDVTVDNVGYINADGVDPEELVAGIDMPSEGKYVKAEPCADGIKITLTETSEYDHYKNNLGSISVNGKDIYIDIASYSDSYIKEYVYPFVEKDKEYIVTFGGAIVDKSNGRKTPWVGESVKVKAGGGRDLSKYVTAEQLEKYKSIKPEVKVEEKTVQNYYGEPEKLTIFTWGFKQDVNNINDFCNLSEVDSVNMDKSMLLGELNWANESAWYGGNNFYFEKDGSAYVPSFNENYDGNYGDLLNFFEAAKTNDIPFIWGTKKITEADWAKHDNKYCSSMTFKFVIDNNDYNFSYPTRWSDQYIFHEGQDDYKEYTAESTKNLDLEAALKAGIADVKADGFITSQEDLFAVAVEVVNEFMAMAQSETVANRSIVNPEGTPAKTVMEATKQLVKFINSAYNEILSAENSMKYYGGWQILLDRTVNIGELTASQWFDTFIQVYVDFMNLQSSYNNWTTITVAEVKQMLAQELPAGITLDQIFELADKYVSIKQLYAKANIDSFLTEEKLPVTEGKAALVTVEALLELGVVNLQEAMETIYGMFAGEGAPALGNVPVKAVTAKVEAQVKADVDYDDIRDNMAAIEAEDLSALKLDAKLASAGFSVVSKAAICTATGKGGIVTVEVGAGADASKVVGIYTAVTEIMTSGDLTKLSELEDLKTLKISVSDGTKNTWEHEYTIAEIVELVSSYIGDVE